MTSRGRLRIYLGAAPGVGKTYSMLSEGRRRRQRGTDVVVGVLDPSPPNTQALVHDLPFVGPGDRLDVESVLARRPDVVLVDELARDNPTGSPNRHRWQDIEQLLVANIDVITTVDIDQIESQRDVAERLLGAAPTVTVPDAFLRRAEQIELVDMTPEALRRRLAHGNIVAPEQIDAAVTARYQPATLAALRELALHWLADRVDEQNSGSKARERVVVTLSGIPDGDRIVRRAARLAQRTRAQLLGVHVRAHPRSALSDASLPEGVARQRELVVALGGTFHEVVGTDIARSIAEFARAEGATQLVLGATRRSRLAELVKGSVVNDVLRHSGAVDVHVIAHEPQTGALPRVYRKHSYAFSRRRRFGAWIAAAVGLCAVTATLVALRDTVGLPTNLLIYLMLVGFVAAVGGRLPALVTAVASFLLATWFLTPPLHTLSISHRDNVVALIVFVTVAVVVSNYVSIVARRTLEVQRAQAEAEALARLTAVGTQHNPLGAVVAHLRSTFDLDAAAIVRQRAGKPETLACAGDVARIESGAPQYSEPIGADVQLVLSGPALSAADRRVLTSFTAYLAAAIERDELVATAARADALDQANALRGALLQSVSHDLRTPLAAIKASVSSLRQSDVDWPPAVQAELLAAIEDETDRLTALVTNLLDLSRIQAGAVTPNLQRVSFDEAVPAALYSLGAVGHRVALEMAEAFDVCADPALLERVVANLVANAVQWSPPDAPVVVRSSCHGSIGQLIIIDHGPGIDPAQRELALEPFARLSGAQLGKGVGLGLAIANGFTRAMRGALLLEDTPGGGLTAIVAFDRWLPRPPIVEPAR